MKRSKKIVLLAHCILNQNARVRGSASHSGAITDVVKVLVESGVGIVQLPCVETTHFGVHRWAGTQKQFATPSYQRRARKELEPIIADLAEYQKAGYQILAAVGIEGSPTCGIFKTSATDWPGGYPNQDLPPLGLVDGMGTFFEVLFTLMEQCGVKAERLEVSDRRNTPGKSPQEVAAKLKEIIERSAS